MPRTLTTRTLKQAANLTFNIIKTLPNNRIDDERWLHGVVLGILEAKVGDIQYEHPVENGRIDIRHGSSNPDVVELVLVKAGGSGWHAGQNKTELRKLSKTTKVQARRRMLLIIHAFGDSIPFEQMKRNYDNYTTSNGERSGYFGSNSIRVVYVHPRTDYNFIWKPPRIERRRASRQRLG